MEPKRQHVLVGKWQNPREFFVFGGFIQLEVVRPGCNCPICIRHLTDVVHTLKSKKIQYEFQKLPPDGWAIMIDLKDAKEEDAIKLMSEAIGLPITLTTG